MADENNNFSRLFWDRVEIKMKEKNISLSRLAKLSGLSSQSLSMARKNNSMQSFERGMKIAQALGVPPEYLFMGDDGRNEDYEDSVVAIRGNKLGERVVVEVANLNYEARHKLLYDIMMIRQLMGDSSIISFEDFANGT